MPCTWGAILTTVSVALQVERFRNWSGTNYKLNLITYSNVFSFHSSAFPFMRNITVKLKTFNLYTLYIGFWKRHLKLMKFYVVFLKLHAISTVSAFSSSTLESLPGVASKCFWNDRDKLPVTQLVTVITVAFTFDTRCISINTPFCFFLTVLSVYYDYYSLNCFTPLNTSFFLNGPILFCFFLVSVFN
jgi:hypothetical protein